jgi:ribosome-associated protein
LKKADNIDILDLSGISILADFFVFAAGFAQIQIQALAREVLEQTKAEGYRHRALEGLDDSGWILIDFGDVVVHLMTHESRDYYRLERLWGDAPKVAWKPRSEEMEKE